MLFLKELLTSGSIPDFASKYHHDPYSVAQFLYEILASSEKGLLSKVGQYLLDSVELDLDEFPELKHYKLSLLHSVILLIDEESHSALCYTLDLLRTFSKIRPETSLPFLGSKFGPIVLKDFPAKAGPAFSTLLANFNAILGAKEDINFIAKDGHQVPKDGRHLAHGGSLLINAISQDRLFEKLLDPYYRGKPHSSLKLI